MTSEPLFSIAAVERETGLGKDTLRVWERRYGFPAPRRDAKGERAFSVAELDKLRLLKRLLDAGHRPGQVVARPIDELRALEAHTAPRARAGAEAQHSADLDDLLDLLDAHALREMRAQLRQALVRKGLSNFVTEVVSPLSTLVGDGWASGRFDIYQEHSYTELAQGLLRSGIQSLPESGAQQRPRVLLSTLPGEPHGLGLLMAEALFAAEGAHCSSLGVQTPVSELLLAAAAYGADIVALSFSACMTASRVHEGLADLRTGLPPDVELWAGGAAPALQRHGVEGVNVVRALADLPAALRRWRDRHGPAAA